jgi:GAF domain-containing protein
MAENELQTPNPAFNDLIELIRSLEASRLALLPDSSQVLLQSIIDAATRIFGAARASLFLVDEASQELVFRVACNASDSSLIGMRIPLDRGIAGYVAMTGQPLAISNVQQDPRFNRDFAKSTGYIPQSILATPLLMDERVIGVMEVLDKISASSFGLQDMELLALFAEQAAIAIHQSQQVERLDKALRIGLKRILEADATWQVGEGMAALDQVIEQAKPDDEILQLADLFRDISKIGEAERKACWQILQTFAAYARSRSRIRR